MVPTPLQFIQLLLLSVIHFSEKKGNESLPGGFTESCKAGEAITGDAGALRSFRKVTASLVF